MTDMLQKLDSPVQSFLLMMVAFLILFLAVAAVQKRIEESLDDPDNKDRVYLEQLPVIARLTAEGPFRIRLIERGGYIRAEYETTTAPIALSQTMAAFERANIDAIHVRRNTVNELHVRRLFCGHCKTLGEENSAVSKSGGWTMIGCSSHRSDGSIRST